MANTALLLFVNICVDMYSIDLISDNKELLKKKKIKKMNAYIFIQYLKYEKTVTHYSR